ncbi:MAG: alpha/beta hydrolase [Streptosporangiaceae bacterium]|jgi:acetyl esterase/lipase
MSLFAGPDVPGMTAADEAELARLLAALEADTWPDDFVEARSFYDAWGTPVAPDIAVREREVGGVPAYLHTPPDADSAQLGIWLHGGGYVFGSQRSHGSMVAEGARAAGCPILHPQYRRAPEHRYPAALQDAVAVYAAVLAEGRAPDQVVMIGDSAGGGLVLTTLLAARDRGLPMPRAVACISPWTDLACTGETFRTLAGDDPMVSTSVTRAVAAAYLAGVPGSAAQLPYASPLYGDVRGFPPALIQVGERELLRSDAERIAAKLTAAASPVTLEVWPGMVHVWHLHHTRLAKGREALARLGAFLRSSVPTTA